MPADRTQDSSPFYGADLIWANSVYCTSGPNVVSNTSPQTYVLTAGLCFPQGATVYTNNSNAQKMGTVSSVVFGGGSVDAELIPSSTVNALWGNGVTYVVKSSIDPGVGSTVCFDGAFTGENCGNGISQHDVCIHYTTGQTVCHVAEVVNQSHTVCQIGDSGSPVYRRSVTG